jgi:ribosomal protein L7Ae-like RNA K-turn-binding protein
LVNSISDEEVKKQLGNLSDESEVKDSVLYVSELNLNDETKENYERFLNTAELLKGEKEVKDLVDVLEKVDKIQQAE